MKKLKFKKKMNEKKEEKIDRNSKNGGFTLVETLVALAVMAMAAGGVTAAVNVFSHKARTYITQQTIAQYKSALQSYYLDCGTYPSTEQGLKALWEKPILVPVPSAWQGPYLDKEIKPDAWGTEFIYVKKGSANFPNGCPENLPFAIISYGADGVSGGKGWDKDIESWR